MSTCTSCTRRSFLGGAVAATAVAGLDLAAFPRLAFAADGAIGDTLVVVVLRGGLDALSAVVPVAESGYYDRRPRIAVPASQTIALDGQFGLHPGLARLNEHFRAGELAIVHAIGGPEASRSHFRQTDVLERGATTSTSTGWIGRHLSITGGAVPRGVAFGGRMPQLMAGAPRSLAAPLLSNIEPWPFDSERSQALQAIRALADGSELATATADALAVSARLDSVNWAAPARNGASYGDHSFDVQLGQVGQLVNAGVGLGAAVIELGGWDTHAGVGSASSGYLRTRLDLLGSSLHAFATDMRGKPVTTVVLSEFGRRVKENGSSGVDHGRGGVAFVFGPGVRGGQVYGAWPGLDAADLDQGDLRVTTDFRDLLGEIVANRLGNAQLATVFPGHTVRPLGLTRPL